MNELERMEAEAEKNYEKSATMSYMVLAQVLNYDVKKILSDQGIKKTVIYGMGEEGITLYRLLKEHNVNIVYATDRNYEDIMIQGVDIINPEDIKNDSDAIIVSSHYYFEEIRNSLASYISVPILSAKVLFENILMCTFA